MNRQFYDNEREIDLAEQKTLHEREKNLSTFLTARRSVIGDDFYSAIDLS